MSMSLVQIVGLIFVVFVVLFRRQILRPIDRLSSSWSDAFIKATTIVLFLVLFVILIPSWAVQTETVAKLDRPIQDLIGSGLWVGGLSAGIGGLWLAHRDSRI